MPPIPTLALPQWWRQQISPDLEDPSADPPSNPPHPPIMPATIAYTSFLQRTAATSLQLQRAANQAAGAAAAAAAGGTLESAWKDLGSPILAAWPANSHLKEGSDGRQFLGPAEEATSRATVHSLPALPLAPRHASLFAALRIMTAMCPCFRLYAAIGWHLQQAVLAQGGRAGEVLYARQLPDKETAEAAARALEGFKFKKWISTYGGAEFEVCTAACLGPPTV